MAITKQTIDLWSKEKQEIIPFVVETKTEEDAAGNHSSYVSLSNSEEEYRLSPNYSDDELLKLQEEMNQGH